MNTSKVSKVLEESKVFLKEATQNEKYRVSKNSFQLDGKISFETVSLFLLNMPNRSLAVELESFFDLTEMESFSPSAFSQARYKLEPIFFKDFNTNLVSNFYQNYQKELKSYNGYYLHGIDGSTLYLLNTDSILDEFGTAGNKHSQVAMARCLFRYDLMNEFITDAKIAPIVVSEHPLGFDSLQQVSKNVISIYDRNFASIEFIYEHQRFGLKYVMRAKLGFNNQVKDFVSSGKREAIYEIPINSNALKKMRARGIEPNCKTVKVRLIAIDLPSGEKEILMTNLMKQEGFTCEDLDVIYDSRWGVETYIDRIKNKMKVEIFAGQKAKAVYQEFAAAVFLLNLQTALLKDCEPVIDEISLNRQHDYKANINVVIGLLKDKIVLMMMADSEESLLIVRNIRNKLLKYLSPVRAGRSYERKKKAQRKNGKYRTLTNYKPAI